MRPLDAKLVTAALAATGEALTLHAVPGPIRLVIIGGVAGLLAGLLRPSRTTGDCDVMAIHPEHLWPAVASAAAEAAAKLGLPPGWLNRECRMYAWCLPLGWDGRCVQRGRFGPLEVVGASRADLIAMKIVSAPKRPQDLEDLRDLGPTAEDLALAEEHVSRLERESLHGQEFVDQRSIIRALRGER